MSDTAEKKERKFKFKNDEITIMRRAQKLVNLLDQPNERRRVVEWLSQVVTGESKLAS